ncbi:phage tail assembly chaperone [Hyphococcus sp.]|uniref:phage tail assembly chaperone n=1 Tax=Hyphococcus sp. TaxID=2038636 RepID=UPI00208A6EE8|nr:MAG: hypothetical protein DHS20C04_24370 [Marinicaulis sp.]
MFSFAVSRLALAPQDFWSLSLSEWRALVCAVSPQSEAMTSEALAALMQKHGGPNG